MSLISFYENSAIAAANVKCDRASPCGHCIKVGTQCSYASGPKPRERRQRVMVSKTYDVKLDEISRKIDDLSQRVSQLSHAPTKSSIYQPIDFADSININQGERCLPSSFGLTPSSPSPGSIPTQESLPYNPTGVGVREVQDSSSKVEYEGESSLFAHAVFACRFLQNAIDNTANAEVAHEMQAVLNGLRVAVHSGKQQSDTLDTLYTQAKSIPPGSTTRNLTLPPIDKVFMCLRMARENPQVATLWLGDFIRPSQFNDYFIKVASPGPATEADLIIVHCGLCWLFCECSKVVADEDTKHDYHAQASMCEANLETVLANLRFHQPTNVDFAYAMGMASLYCLQKNKPSAAWHFVNSASHMVQALGLQHNVPTGTEGPEGKAQMRNLFSTIYVTEKMLSLRLGRSSTFRDQDITLSGIGMERPNGSFLAELAPSWMRMASIQGRIYDDIYSPGALKQPAHIRTSHARALASELKTAMQHAQDIHDHYEASKGQVLGLDYHEIARRSDRVIGLSMLTLIYRSIAPEKPSTSTFCQECIDAARDTLQEHDRCVAVITKARGKTVFLESYLNWFVMDDAPFRCRPDYSDMVVQDHHPVSLHPLHHPVLPHHRTPEVSDLEHMRGLVDTLESTSNSHAHSTCSKQRRLFRALYDVAAKYVEVKSRADGGPGEMSWSMTRQEYADAFGATISNVLGLGTLNSIAIVGDPGTTNTSGAPGHMASHDEANGDRMGLVDGLGEPTALQNTAFADEDMEMDLSGAQLWDWFTKNQAIMRMLEDT
ncbi:C6 transcription factor [Aspergillus bombycis]|uniref:C6 transcription factor n=1 Tax=Aspergillus bombycis TaxID=109264 RepID=A0A1F8A933_9EURO|nr:C6 transcription factor [Aspergillus bombycis]OGM48193.1 C6 transcription factor [Aspergillus bombycis]